MAKQSNIIELIGIKNTRPTLSCIRHHVERWIERQPATPFSPNGIAYRVTVRRDPDELPFTCEIDVNLGNTHWTGCESGKTLQDSLERTLAHLHRELALGSTRVSSTQSVPIVA